MITVAGSGPSSENYDKKVTIATKKVPCDSEYIYVPHVHFWHTFKTADRQKPLIVRKENCTCKKCRDCEAPVEYELSKKVWWDYYAQFNPKFLKPSIGTEAVFVAIQRWQPETVGVIGLDWVLDGNPDWFHDAEKELSAILSLVNIKDLRDEHKLVRRIRPPRGVRLPHFLSERY